MDNQNQYGKSKFVTASMLLGILSAVLLTVSLFVPAIDLSAYHAQVQIRYSIMKICENVGLISDMWRGIPIGILIAAVGMLVLSFVRIPPLKAIPCMIVVFRRVRTAIPFDVRDDSGSESDCVGWRIGTSYDVARCDVQYLDDQRRLCIWPCIHKGETHMVSCVFCSDPDDIRHTCCCV